jgi:hypothetical protein
MPRNINEIVRSLIRLLVWLRLNGNPGQGGKLEAVYRTGCLKRKWLAGIRATTISLNSDNHTANEGPVRIQYKCQVSIYVLTEIKLLFRKQNYDVLSPSSYTHIPVRDLYISRIGLPILLQENMWTGPCEYINRSQTHECGNWD